MAENIYEPSVTYFQVKTVRHKFHHEEPIIAPNVPKGILDKYKNVNLFCDLIHINSTVFPNNVSRHILFAKGRLNKNRRVNNMDYGIKQVKKLYLQRGFNINRIHSDNEFEPLQAEIANIFISLNCASKKEHVPNI